MVRKKFGYNEITLDTFIEGGEGFRFMISPFNPLLRLEMSIKNSVKVRPFVRLSEPIYSESTVPKMLKFGKYYKELGDPITGL